MKIILSRKGFDSSAGGVASPITPSGQLVSLAIPDEQSAVRYRDLKGSRPSIAYWVESLSRGKVRGCDGVHLDPDLDAKSLRRDDEWVAGFGQAGAALGHLDAQDVAVGDLFLFFGWFRQVEKTAKAWRYVPNAPDLHVLYGWLAVGEIWRQPEPVPRGIAAHIHCQREFRGNNAVYMAARHYSGLSKVLLPGAGLCSHIDPALVLSDGERRSQWKLPAWFHPEGRQSTLSYHQKMSRWSKHGEHCRLEAAARGQEFVLDCDHYPEARAWAGDLIARMAAQKP